jgi:hypothetical protein
LLVNNCNSTIIIDEYNIKLSPNKNTIISDSTYTNLLKNNSYFLKLLDNKIIVCVPITDNKIIHNINNTITQNNDTTNIDSINVVNTINGNVVNFNNSQQSEETLNNNISTNNVENKTTTNIKNKRGRKTRLVENVDV